MTTHTSLKDVSSKLSELAKRDQKLGIKQKFDVDQNRTAKFSQQLAGIHFDFSKTHISAELMDQYADFAKHVGFAKQREGLFRGEKINQSEHRAVLHTLLRDTENHGLEMLDAELKNEASRAAESFTQSFEEISQSLAAREVPIRSIIHIGIGGSSLGTQLLFEALKRVAEPIDIHFAANIDGHELEAVLHQCDPRSTLIIGVSKTFTTAETLQNIRSVGEWYSRLSQGSDFMNQVIAVTANPDNAAKFGVPAKNTVVFPNWVGGRYSVWSAVSLSAALVLGFPAFKEFLQGAADMDEHFLTAPPRENLSFIAASLDHYYVNHLGAQSRAIFAYDYRLRSLVDYLQQLETESNGKDRTNAGEPVPGLTSPIVWGGVGTDVQHSVFQLLHQGTHLIPAEFILVKQAEHNLSAHHKELLANGLAQPAALLAGQTLEEVKQRHAEEGLSRNTQQAKVFSGERPSTTILLQRLTPHTLGALLAFYEQRTFCYGVLCQINSFDQMGVELGKRLAKQIRPLLQETPTVAATGSEQPDFDPSTLDLLRLVNAVE